jgi:hypothetical protein
VDNVRQYSADNPPPYPVTSVNGKTGAVSLTIPSEASDVKADPAGTASTVLTTHNVDTESHQDIRLMIKEHEEAVNALLNSDDETLNETKEIVAYIKSNKDLIDDITTSKVSVDHIINNLTTNATNKPLSAAQGVALKALIDALGVSKLDASKLTESVNTALAQAKASGEFDGEKGDPGASVTVSNVTTSSADGGSNVVTFSDGKTLTVKNGSKGSPGATGKSAYAYAKDGGYAGTEEEFAEDINPDNIIAETESFVIDELAKRGQLKPEFANSVEELNEKGDTTKLYVLPDGYIYAHMQYITEGKLEPDFKNVMDDPDASIKEGVRYSQSGAASGAQWKTEAGDCSIIIPMTSKTPTIRVRGAGNDAKYNNYIYVSYDGKDTFPITPEYTRTVADNGDITITVNTTLSTPKYATFAVKNGFDKDSLIVTVDQDIVYKETEGEIGYRWESTGRAFVPADYESRIVSAENTIEEHDNRISELENEITQPKPTGIVTMFISPNGDDNNTGLSVSSPKKTVKACMDSGATRISAKRGTYNEQITLSNIDVLEIFPTDNDYTFDANVKRYPPIVFDTSHTIPVSNLSAYNSIKKVAYAETNEAFTYVFTNGLYDRVYSTTHGYHAVLWAITGNIKNDFKLKPLATIAEVEATVNSFTWVNNTIYLNADLTHVTEIRVPTIYDNALTVFTANKVKLTDVEIRFAGRYNILIENCPNVEMDNCSVKYSSNGSGFDMKNANGILRNCYASRVHDGYGIGDYGHTIFVDCVAEWCYDDGMSHHRGCTGTVIGGRYEGNGKAGNCPAHGANVNIYGGLYKDNALWGIAYWYENTYNPCTGMVQGAVMVGNPKGLVVDAGSSVTALNCHYVGNTKDKEITGTLVEY